MGQKAFMSYIEKQRKNNKEKFVYEDTGWTEYKMYEYNL